MNNHQSLCNRNLLSRLSVLLCSAFTLVITGILFLAACTPIPITTTVIISPSDVPTDSLALKPTIIPSSTIPSTPIPIGNTITVTSIEDSGTGTLRQALLDAQPYDTILFDPSVFPPDSSSTIFLKQPLPNIHQDNISIDASDAGVVLDGSMLLRPGWDSGLQIVSNGTVIRGLKVTNFSGTGIVVAEGRGNTIGGDRGIGRGPFGQGNQCINNDFGIGLWNRAKENIVTGNIIGTDASGFEVLGNGSGMWITENATDNRIGPNNIIAFNAGAGIVIEGPGSLGNTITQNSIYGNGGTGIYLENGSNAYLSSPFIFEYNMAEGYATGVSCHGCSVEVFSDNDDEGAVFEGRATTSQDDVFSLALDRSFNGPRLTAYQTDADGNTSEFSLSILGDSERVTLQMGNALRFHPLNPRRSNELLDNHTGAYFEEYGGYSDTDLFYRNGFKRIRIQALTRFWSKGEVPGDELGHAIYSLESIPPEVDAAIDDYNRNGVKIVVSLWMGAGLRPYGTSFQSQEEVEQYLDYVRLVVPHFKSRIHYYEIWNEPGFIEVSYYANLIKQVVPVIRQEDPQAKIIIGAVAGPWDLGYPGYGEYRRFSLNTAYLNALLMTGVAPLVDGISWHPLYDNIASDPYYQGYPDMVAGIKDLAVAQGFKGEYFADELGWSEAGGDAGWERGPPVSQRIATKYFLRVIAEHRGLDVNATMNTFYMKDKLVSIHNICDVLSGTEPVELAMSFESEANIIRQYAFSMPNGDLLVALWNNGQIVDNDPGIKSKLTIPSFSTRKAEVIDILYGLVQELTIDSEAGNLVIHGLLIKDYPIFIRFNEPAWP